MGASPMHGCFVQNSFGMVYAYVGVRVQNVVTHLSGGVQN